MFEQKFTESAKRVISLAGDAAMELGHNYIGTEHLLLGLIRNEDSIASRVLSENQLDDEMIIDKISEFTGISSPIKTNTLSFTPRTKYVLEHSYSEAIRLKHNYIGSEHILISLLRESECLAVAIISSLGGSIKKIYNDVLDMLSDSEKREENSFEGQSRSSKSVRNKNVKTPTLDKFGRDLTLMAKENKLDPIIGRDSAIERVIQILSRRTKNNPCLIGEAGVGKTAVAEGLAQKIVEGSVPEILRDKKVITLDLSSMVAGAKYRGEFEERLKGAMDDIKKAGNIIIFIDEIHTIVGAGAADGAIDAANILKPALARGEIQIIGATTLEEYRRYIEKDSALERRFQPITIDEPTIEESIEILKGIRDKYEAHHKVEISDEAIESAVKLSVRYINDRFLPDKAIDLIDEAASRQRLKALTSPPEIKETEEAISRVLQEKQSAINTQDYEKAARLRDEEAALKEELKTKRENWEKENRINTARVSSEEIAEIISSWTNIPVKTLKQEESERLLKLEEILHKRVVGQEEAVSAVSKSIRRGRVGLKDPKRPIGSFIFLGPTGVGKTELSKALAEAMFGDEEAIIRIDMSEYMEKHSVSRLVGSPPGYVGYDEGGQLTEKVRRKPYSVVLFDEIEKAHPDVFNIMLQILDDGILTDSQGRRVDFRNTVIIMTSNIGSSYITEIKPSLGFSAEEKSDNGYDTIKENVMAELKRTFRPEFLNRIDDTIVFHQLDESNIEEIARKLLSELIERLKANEISITFSDEAVKRIAKNGFDPVYGARPLRRAIQSEIEDMIAEKMLNGEITKGDSVMLNVNDDRFVINKTENNDSEN